jgi:hypothetical protein
MRQQQQLLAPAQQQQVMLQPLLPVHLMSAAGCYHFSPGYPGAGAYLG